MLGDHHQTADVLVQTMDDPRTQHAADPGKAAFAMGEQCVHQRARMMPGGRMHHHAGRFLQHQEMLVLEQDIQRDGFGLGSGRSWAAGTFTEKRCPGLTLAEPSAI